MKAVYVSDAVGHEFTTLDFGVHGCDYFTTTLSQGVVEKKTKRSVLSGQRRRLPQKLTAES